MPSRRDTKHEITPLHRYAVLCPVLAMVMYNWCSNDLGAITRGGAVGFPEISSIRSLFDRCCFRRRRQPGRPRVMDPLSSVVTVLMLLLWMCVLSRSSLYYVTIVEVGERWEMEFSTATGVRAQALAPFFPKKIFPATRESCKVYIGTSS